MPSIFSVAAIILAALGPVGGKTATDEAKVRIGATNAGYTAGWSGPDRLRSTVGFGMPRLPRPRMPRPRWP